LRKWQTRRITTWPKEIRDLLINVQSTRDTAVSVQKAVDRLQKSKKRIRNEKANPNISARQQQSHATGSIAFRNSQRQKKSRQNVKEKYLRAETM
jgi:methylthioribose-1-phosphate isomerase